MKNIRIRRPMVSEKEEINQLFREVLIDTCEKNGIIEFEEFVKEESDDKRKCLNQDFDSEGKDRFFFIAAIEEKIVGTIEYGVSNELIKECTNNELEGMMEIGTVFVHPQYQYQGIGKLLLIHILKELMIKGVDEVCLDSGYSTAQKIWTKKFGNPQYFLKDHWGEDAHHMVWRLKVKEVIE